MTDKEKLKLLKTQVDILVNQEEQYCSYSINIKNNTMFRFHFAKYKILKYYQKVLKHFSVFKNKLIISDIVFNPKCDDKLAAYYNDVDRKWLKPSNYDLKFYDLTYFPYLQMHYIMDDIEEMNGFEQKQSAFDCYYYLDLQNYEITFMDLDKSKRINNETTKC